MIAATLFASTRLVPATPPDTEEIRSLEAALAERMSRKKTDRERGELLTPELERYLRRVTRELLRSDGGKRMLATVSEENPGAIAPLAVGARYPEGAPLSTVPPSLLERFPLPPEGVQYRFAGCRLLLLDVDSGLILDYLPECLW